MNKVTKTFKYSQTGKYWSLILLAIVLIITIGFFVYNYFLEKDISRLSNEISEHKNKIEKLESQNNIYVYSLIKKHKWIIDELDERSKITKYLSHIEKIVNHYNFDIRGFNMSGGNIASKIVFEDNNTGLAYKKAVRFISDYRNDTEALLDLNFITWVSWVNSDVKFPVLFTIK